MKKRLEKLMYMGLGTLIAFGGYLFGTLHSDNVDAQLAPANIEYDEIRCRNLTIVDADGNRSIRLGENEGRGGLIFLDKNGRPAITLLLSNSDQRGIMLKDRNGVVRVSLTVDPNSGGYIAIHDENEKPLRVLR